MSPLAHLLLAAVALHVACAASLPEPVGAAKLVADLKPELEGPLDKDAAPEALVLEDASIVKDINNELRVKPEDIPVKVVIEDSRPATNEVADDDEEIKRPSIDLHNPGPPQHQEHETQNADHFPDAQEKLLTLRETIVQTQDLLRRGIEGVGNDISYWLSTNEQMNTIQQNIQSLRDTFTLQIQKLNEVTKGLVEPHALKAEDISEQAQIQPKVKKVETSIKILEDNFNNGVRALSEGVNIVAILREEDGNAEVAQPPPPPSPAPAQPEPPGTTSPAGLGVVLSGYLSNFQNLITNSFHNITESVNSSLPESVQNFFNPTTLAPGVQADTPEGTPPRPIWPNFQLPNVLNNFRPPGQGEQTQNQPAAPGPLLSFIMSVQNATTSFLQNGFRPGASPASDSSAAGSNVVPQKPADEKQPETPAVTAAASDAAASPAPAAPLGPIRQILSNSPVVQSLAGTVQRIQSSITNPESPREPEKSDLQTKGGFYGGNRPGGSGE